MHTRSIFTVIAGRVPTWLIIMTSAIVAMILPAEPAWAAEPDAAETVAPRAKIVLSKTYDVDQKYKSMKGPSSRQDIVLGESENPELLWITGYKAVMVGADGKSPIAQEFMCHSNLDIDTATHRSAVKASHGFNPRLFTLSQGQFEVSFPPGFGIPIASTESLSLTTQVLNHNLENPDIQVRHQVTVEFVGEEDVVAGGKPDMTPLFPVGAYGLALLEGEGGYFGIRNPDEEEHGASCLPGENASTHVYRDPEGRQFTGHWVVKPGREVNHTNVTELMRVPYDTTAHYIAVHLHPFAESIELVDITAGTSLFKSAARNFEDKIGLAHVDYYTSVEGIPLFKNHEYQIVSTYNNTTDEEQDSMAVMYLYLQDKVFDKDRVQLEAPQKKEAPSAVSLKTSDGL